MSEKELVQVVQEPRLKIEVERGQRGGYGWQIRLLGDHALSMVDEIERIDDDLRQRFGIEEATK